MKLMRDSQTNQFRLGVVLNYIKLGLSSLIPIFYTPIMLRILGQSEYGLYKLSSSLTSYLSLVSLGMGATLSRFIIKAREESGKEAEERVFALFIIIFRVISIISLLVGFVLIHKCSSWYAAALSPEELSRMRILMLIMSVNISMSFLLAPYASIVSAHERYVFIQILGILSTLLIPIINLIVLFLGYASIGLATSSLIIQLLIQFAYLYYSKHSLLLKPVYTKIKSQDLKQVFSFAFWVLLAEIVDKLYSATDTALIGAVPDLGTGAVAVYNMGTVFSGIVFTVGLGISTLLSPRVNRMVFQGTTEEELTNYGIRIARIQSLIICLLIGGFISFGRPFIYYYAGPDYNNSYLVAIMIMIPFIIPIIQNVFLNVVVAKNKHRFRSIVYLIIAALNVLGSWILIRKIGVVGAAAMTGIAMLLGQGIIMNWFYDNKIGLNVKRFWREISPTFLAPSLLSFLFLIIGKWIDFYNLYALLIGIISFTLLYFVINWVLIMNQYERHLLDPIIKRFKH